MVSTHASLCLFGGLLLRDAGGQPVPVPGRKTQRLLGMLALGPPRGLCRESLIELLWPGADVASARHALCTELWRLKASLAAACLSAWIVSEEGRVGLADEARRFTDAVAFEAAVARGRAAAGADRAEAVVLAEGLYVGEFMAGDGDEWCLGRRTYYAALLAELQLMGLRQARDQADWAEVVRRGQLLARAEPLLEDAQQEVMRAHLALGNRAAALATYRALERSLREELDLLPSEETRRLRMLALPARFGRGAVATRPPEPEPASIAKRLRRIADELDALGR